MKKTKSGFTIVELLIVIVVIAVLAAITVVAYNGIQLRARDAERVNDMSVIKKKLELYYIDNGYYPNSSKVTSLQFATDELKLSESAITNPQSGYKIGYCWADSPSRYCYVATRPSPLTGDCTGGGAADPNETCAKYRLSYRTEQDPTTMVTVYSQNW